MQMKERSNHPYSLYISNRSMKVGSGGSSTSTASGREASSVETEASTSAASSSRENFIPRPVKGAFMMTGPEALVLIEGAPRKEGAKNIRQNTIARKKEVKFEEKGPLDLSLRSSSCG